MSARFENALVWDAHSCLPLTRAFDFDVLRRHRDAGVDYVSINVGMDFNPWPDCVRMLAWFRARIGERPDVFRVVGDTSGVKKAKADGVLAISFDLEGAITLDNDLDMLALYRDLGVRQIHLAYNRNNAIGGGCHDSEDGDDAGLTAFGGRVVDEINRLGLLMDCSHTGHRTSMEIMERSSKPVIFSHANARAVTDHPRNIRDDQARACAKTGGVIGVNGVNLFVGDEAGSTAALAEHADYFVQLVGAAHVGIGLDYMYRTDIDDRPPGMQIEDWWPARYGYRSARAYAGPEQALELAEALVRRGYSNDDVVGILGLNFLRAAEATWTP